MKKGLHILFHAVLMIFLTVITCTGGVAHLVWLLTKKKMKKRGVKIILWPLIYFLVWGITGICGELNGRSRLPLSHQIKPASWFYVITNRTFVLDHVNENIAKMEQDLKSAGIELHYLDSAFPFNVPLIPHWSHQSGACVDFSFVYDSGPRGLVYGDFESPRKGESNRPSLCTERNPLYSATGYLCPYQSTNEVDVLKTKKMVLSFLNNPKVQKCFLEDHLVERWGLKHSKMRFHGCHAVRHDDHLHVEWIN